MNVETMARINLNMNNVFVVFRLQLLFCRSDDKGPFGRKGLGKQILVSMKMRRWAVIEQGRRDCVYRYGCIVL